METKLPNEDRHAKKRPAEVSDQPAPSRSGPKADECPPCQPSPSEEGEVAAVQRPPADS